MQDCAPVVSTALESQAITTVETRPPRQIGWVIAVEDRALIRRLVVDGVPHVGSRGIWGPVGDPPAGRPVVPQDEVKRLT